MCREMLGILLFSLRIPLPDSLFASILAGYISAQLSLLNKAMTEKVSNHILGVAFQNT